MVCPGSPSALDTLRAETPKARSTTIKRKKTEGKRILDSSPERNEDNNNNQGESSENPQGGGSGWLRKRTKTVEKMPERTPDLIEDEDKEDMPEPRPELVADQTTNEKVRDEKSVAIRIKQVGEWETDT